VDGDGGPGACDGHRADFSTIAAALAVVARGDTILVCPGTYVEQVTVTTDDLTLESLTPRAATIVAPAAMSDPKAVIRVHGAHNVTIRNFTISSSGAGRCQSIRDGVRVDGGGSITLDGNNIRDTPERPSTDC
jgi:pectin methylesterase-like acyl-CoA thioesterase